MVFNAYGFMKGLAELIASAALVGVFGGVSLALVLISVNWLTA